LGLWEQDNQRGNYGILMVIVTHKYKNNFTVIDEIYCLFLSNGKIKLIEYLAQINKYF
jgi:ABC-type transporter Mla maintaining outer membrane lipid asymmetry ATPase subunit MlaF